MSTIHDLNKSITDMSSEECFSLLKKIRSSRRSPIKFSKTASKSKKKTIDISTMMQSLSSDDRSAILKELEGLT